MSRSGGSIRPHLIWEAVLLALTVVAAVVWYSQDGSRLSPLVFNIASAGLLATAFALSLRTATPNLAVVAVGALAGLTYAEVLDAGAPVLVAAVPPLAAAAGVGGDGHEMAAHRDLPTMAQNAHDQGVTAASMLLEMITGAPVPQEVVFPTTLVARGSSGRVRDQIVTRP